MKTIYMDEVNNSVVTIMDLIKPYLEKKLEYEKEEDLFNSVQAELDKLCGFPDYQNYN